MSNTSSNNALNEIKAGSSPTGNIQAPVAEYHFTFVESSSVPVSLVRQILAWFREPKITVPKQYYRGEAALPATDMRPWILDFPKQIKALFEKPKPPRIPITSKPLDLPNLWQDYQQQPGAWVNSVLVHVVGIAILMLPFYIEHMVRPVKASTKYAIVDVSPYLAELQGAAKRMGGGGGGGDRSPTPASKGAIPKFAKQQLAPPMAVIRNPAPKLQVEPTLLGPPELKLPEMALNMPWGDPNGVVGPPSNGPGTGGGIGSGEGTGIGSGRGAGLGPGEGGGVGGGAYSVGGSVSAPVPIYAPNPPYSEEARKAKYQGTVALWIVVDAHGNVNDCRVVKPLGLGLDEKAVETVRTWKFKPGMRNGVPVAVRVAVEVQFRLF